MIDASDSKNKISTYTGIKFDPQPNMKLAHKTDFPLKIFVSTKFERSKGHIQKSIVFPLIKI